MELLDPHVERLLRGEIQDIVSELGLVDLRLEELRHRNDDDSRLEYVVLQAYRRHLLEDLEQLAKFGVESDFLDSGALIMTGRTEVVATS